MIALMMTEEEVVFELFGEAGERQEFSYDSEPALELAIEMIDCGYQALGRMHEVGYEQMVEDFGFEDDPTKGDNIDTPDSTIIPQEWLDKPDDPV